MDKKIDKIKNSGAILTRLSRETVCPGTAIDFCRDEMRLPDGKREGWDFVHHRKGGGACIVPLLPDGRILMIRQMRPAVDRETLELPAGAFDPGESPKETAARELLEETGWRAGRLTRLVTLDTAVAWCDESTVVFLGEDLSFAGEQQLDEAEAIGLEKCRPEDVLEAIFAGRIRDAKTVAGILAFKAFTEKARA